MLEFAIQQLVALAGVFLVLGQPDPEPSRWVVASNGYDEAVQVFNKIQHAVGHDSAVFLPYARQREFESLIHAADTSSVDVAILEERDLVRATLFRPGLIVYRSDVSGRVEDTNFIVPAQSDANSLSDLQSRCLGLGHERSNSSFHLPLLVLLEHGLSLTLNTTVRDTPAQGSVAITLGDEEDTQMLWLARDYCDAAAFGDGDVAWAKKLDDPNTAFKILKREQRSLDMYVALFSAQAIAAEPQLTQLLEHQGFEKVLSEQDQKVQKLLTIRDFLRQLERREGRL